MLQSKNEYNHMKVKFLKKRKVKFDVTLFIFYYNFKNVPLY